MTGSSQSKNTMQKFQISSKQAEHWLGIHEAWGLSFIATCIKQASFISNNILRSIKELTKHWEMVGKWGKSAILALDNLPGWSQEVVVPTFNPSIQETGRQMPVIWSSSHPHLYFGLKWFWTGYLHRKLAEATEESLGRKITSFYILNDSSR